MPEGYRDPDVIFNNFKATSINGENCTLDSLKGKITFVNFWFKECEPCLAEFDDLNNLYHKYKGYFNFRFLSFTFDTKEDALTLASKYNLDFPIFCMDKNVIYHLNFDLGFPTTMIINKNDIVAYIKCGGSLNEDKIKEDVEILFSREIDRIMEKEASNNAQ